MAVSFANISSNTRVPLFYAELDNSAAGVGGNRPKSLLIGQMLASGIATAGVPVPCASLSEAGSLAGLGSPLYRMVKKYKAQNTTEELWILPITEASGTKAAWTITNVVSTLLAGTYNLWIGDEHLAIGITAGLTAAQVATAIVAAITAKPELPVTAAAGSDASAHIVTITYRSKGTVGNQCIIRANYLGAIGGEYTPSGLAATLTQSVQGATDPDISTSLANLGDEAYAYIGHHFADATNIGKVTDEMNDSTGRWSPARQLYGHAYVSVQDTIADLGTFASTHNDQHHSIIGYEPERATPAYELVAAVVGKAAVSLSIDPARPLQTLALSGVSPCPQADRFTSSERNTLLYDGISTITDVAGTVRIERLITTYRLNGSGVEDASYLDVTTLYNLAYQLSDLKSRITTKYGRHKLANDGTRFGPGNAIVTPNVIRNEIVAAYRQYESLGLVENVDAMLEHLIVERNALDPNRLDVLYPPDLVNQFNVLALLAQFRLQYDTTAA